MAARNRHMHMLNHNGRSDDTTSGTSRSTESETQESYIWRRNDPPLPEVDTTKLLQMRRLEELHANELQQRIQPSRRRYLNITSPNMTRFQQTDREVRIFYRRVNIPCRHRIRSIKELLRRFYVSRCGPEPKYSQRIGLNGGTTKIACAR